MVERRLRGGVDIAKGKKKKEKWHEGVIYLLVYLFPSFLLSLSLLLSFSSFLRRWLAIAYFPFVKMPRQERGRFLSKISESCLHPHLSHLRISLWGPRSPTGACTPQVPFNTWRETSWQLVRVTKASSHPFSANVVPTPTDVIKATWYHARMLISSIVD